MDVFSIMLFFVQLWLRLNLQNATGHPSRHFSQCVSTLESIVVVIVLSLIIFREQAESIIDLAVILKQMRFLSKPRQKVSRI